MLPVLHQFGAYETPGCGYGIGHVLALSRWGVNIGWRGK